MLLQRPSARAAPPRYAARTAHLRKRGAAGVGSGEGHHDDHIHQKPQHKERHDQLEETVPCIRCIQILHVRVFIVLWGFPLSLPIRV